MSLQALLGPIAAEIDDCRTLADLKEVLSRNFASAAPIEARTPIKINNHTNGPALQIINSGDADHHGLLIKDSIGRETRLGIGLGNQGIIANGVITDRVFSIDQDVVQERYDDHDVASGYDALHGKFVPDRFNLEFPKVSRRCSSAALLYSDTMLLNYGLAGYQYTTLTGSPTVTIDNTKFSTGQTMWWEVVDTAGSHTVTFVVSGGGSLVWDGGTQPADLAAGKGRVYSFTRNSAGNLVGGVSYNSY